MIVNHFMVHTLMQTLLAALSFYFSLPLALLFRKDSNACSVSLWQAMSM